MDEMEKLAQWHEERASLDWLPERAHHHTAAAATIRAAITAIEAFLERYDGGDPGDTAYVAELMRAALKAPAHD